MASSKSITAKQVKSVILKFYKLMDSRAHLVDFFEILHPDILIKFKKLEFRGYREFEDHQEGKRGLFDEIHKVVSCDVEVKNGIATAKTVGNWQGSVWKPPAPKSTRLKAAINHTWKLKRNHEGSLVIYSHIVTSLKFEGELPDYMKQ